VKWIAARIGKSYQTVYREIARNRKPDGRYQPWFAHNQAHLRRRRPKPRRLAVDDRLRAVVADKLSRHWSPRQISRWLRRRWPRRRSWQLSIETIYEAVYRGLVVVTDRQTLRTGPVVMELREHRVRQAAERLAAGASWHDAPYVITTATGRPLDRTSDRREWHELTTTAGVRRLRIHDLRHSAATALLVLGEDSRVLLAVMGWTSIGLAQRYTHLVPDLRRQVASRQSALWTN
jgi:integrase